MNQLILLSKKPPGRLPSGGGIAAANTFGGV
jgi:hypothetical protein